MPNNIIARLVIFLILSLNSPSLTALKFSIAGRIAGRGGADATGFDHPNSIPYIFISSWSADSSKFKLGNELGLG